MRVTGGNLRGRRLRSPQGGLRPTSDRVREAVFARLDDIDGCAVLDLYAGTGALGIEAVSRGATTAVFVERAVRCLSVLRANVTALGSGADTRVVADDAPRAVKRLARAGQRFDLVFVDPPYASGETARALEAIAGSDVLTDGAMVVVESGRRQPPVPVPGLAVLDERRYGDTLISRLVVAETAATGGSEGG